MKTKKIINVGRIPRCGYRAPIYSFRKDNASHGGGYHIHLYKLKNGKYVLTNIVFSRVRNKVYAYTHCEGKSKEDYELSKVNTSKMLKDLKVCGLIKDLSKKREWSLMFSKERVYLCDI